MTVSDQKKLIKAGFRLVRYEIHQGDMGTRLLIRSINKDSRGWVNIPGYYKKVPAARLKMEQVLKDEKTIMIS
jgi:hypothetical protein